MAKYSYDKYGNFIYGTPNTDLTPYYQSKIKAEVVDYLTINVTWQPIVPDPADGPASPTWWALVKTFNGKPDDPYDGRVIAADIMANYATNFTEQYITVRDAEVTYSIWVFNENRGWIFCGQSSAIVIPKEETPDLISKWIPRAWQNDKEKIGDSVGEYELQDLMTAITAYSVEYDRLRTNARMLEKANTSKYITNNYALVKQLDYGFAYEPNLGDPYYRTLAITGDRINSLKGTINGISEYVTALTHIQNKIEIGHNLFLDYNDSSFEESTGRWGLTSQLITAVKYEDVSFAAPSPNVYDVDAIPRSVGLLNVPASGSGFALYYPDLPVGIGYGPKLQVLDKAIPVEEGKRYLFTGWARTSTNYSITVSLTWVDAYSNIISSVNAVNTLTLDTWTEFKSASDAYRTGQLAPKGAAFVYIEISGSNNPNIYFDMFQFCEAEYSFVYEDPRLIKIYLRGQEENLIRNAQFADGLAGWHCNSYVTLTQYYDNASVPNLEITSNGGAPYLEDEGLGAYAGGVIWSDWMEVDPGISYTFSINKQDVLSPSLGNNPFILGIEFSNQSTEEDQSSVKEIQDTFYYDNYDYNTKVRVNVFDINTTGPTPVYTLTLEQDTPFYNGDKISLIGSEIDPNGIYTVIDDGDPRNIIVTPTFNIDPENEEYTSDTGYAEYGFIYAVLCTSTNPPTPIRKYGNTTELYVPGNVGTQRDGKNSVTAIAPPATRDSGNPYARVYIKVPTGTTYLAHTRFSPALLQDRTITSAGTGGPVGLLSPFTPGLSDPLSLNPTYTDDYFDGYGNYSGVVIGEYGPVVDPISAKYYGYENCHFEKSVRYNFVNNSDFESGISDWTALGSSVLSFDTTQGAIGTSKSMKVTDSSGLAGGAKTTVQLPYPAIGGETITASAYVRITAGSLAVNISMPEAKSPHSLNDRNYVITDAARWFRIQKEAVLDAGQTSVTLTINSAITNGGTSFNIDGVQVEWGSIATPFITLIDAGTFSLANPNYFPGGNGGNGPHGPSYLPNTMMAAYNQEYNSGKSSFIPQLPIKFNRLFAILHNFVPSGSTWALKIGWPTSKIKDIEYSLIPSASFENDLGDWSPISATLRRVLYMGNQVDHVTHGIAYGEVTTTKMYTAQDYSFGITSDKIYINPNKGYYGSVAVRPKPGTGAAGFYKLEVDAFDENDVLLQTFDNTLIFKEDYILPGNTFTESATPPSTPAIGDRWLATSGSGEGRMYTWTQDTDGLQWVENDEYNYYINNYQPDTRYIYSEEIPSNPTNGLRWIDTANQIGYIWLEDAEKVGATSYWVNGIEYPVTNTAVNGKWVELAVVYADAAVWVDDSYAPRWAYLNIVIPKGNLVLPVDDPNSTLPLLKPASYVKFRVACQPDSFTAGQSFHVDRAVFRE